MAMLKACDRFGTTKKVEDVLITVVVAGQKEYENSAVLCPRAIEALKKRIELSTTPTPESKNGSSEG